MVVQEIPLSTEYSRVDPVGQGILGALNDPPLDTEPPIHTLLVTPGTGAGIFARPVFPEVTLTV